VFEPLTKSSWSNSLTNCTLVATVHPVERQIREINAPVLVFLLDMCLEAEPEHAMWFPHKITLMVGAVMLISVATDDQKKWRSERSGLIQG
jgi:hypothetical protein